MAPKIRIVAVLFILLAPGLALASPFRWLVYYGSQFQTSLFQKLDLVILDPDNMTPPLTKGKTRYIAYLSVGEVNTTRPYWPEIAGKDFLVEQNPDWPDAWRVDIRSQKWQQFLLDKLIPEIIKKGYDSFFLDTVDTPLYLEEQDPQKFKGAKEAMIQFVKNLRKKYPQMGIYPNNALALLKNYGEEVDGVVVEDLYSRFNNTKKKIEKSSVAETASREKQIDAFKRQFPKKPILNIIYNESVTPPLSPLAKEAIRQSEKKGYDWYLTTPDLMTIGWVRP